MRRGLCPRSCFMFFLVLLSLFPLITLGAEDLQVTDITGIVHYLNDAYINYPSTFGPSKVKDGIAVMRGRLESFIEWSDIKMMSNFKVCDQKDSDGGFIIEADLTLNTGETTRIVLSKDWSMKPIYGGKGLLFGKTKSGETVNIEFPDIKELIVVSQSNSAISDKARVAIITTICDTTIKTSEFRFTYKWGEGEREWQLKLASGIIVTIPINEIAYIKIMGPTGNGTSIYTTNINLETTAGNIYEGMSYNGSMITALLPDKYSIKDLATAFRTDGNYGKELIPEIKEERGKVYIAIDLQQLKSISFMGSIK